MNRSITLGAVILAVSLLGTAPARAGGFEDARRISEISETADLAGRLDICRSILGENPVPWARSFCEGYLALADGNVAMARTSLGEALDGRGDFVLGPILYGDLAAETGHLDTAVELYEQALKLQPARTDALFALGSAYFRLGREQDLKYFPQALESFRQLAQADPTSPDGWSHMGLVLMNMGRTADAEAMYRKAIEKNPQDPFLYDGLASLYSRQGQDGPAEENWRHAIAVNPGYGPALVELAALDARTGKLEQALSVLENGRTAARVAPWGARIRRNLAFAYLRLGLEPLARARFVEAVQVGGDALAELGLAHLDMIAKEEAAALAGFEAGCALDSSMATPFVQAWRDQLGAATRAGETPALRRVLDGLDRPRPGKDGKIAAPAIPKELRGTGATDALAGFVLPDWSFADAEAVKAKMADAPADSLGNRYDTPPVPLEQAAAEYPESAEAAGLTGTVQVLVSIDETGKVTEVRLKLCDAPQMLCDAAVSAARKWTFRPATRYGQPVKAAIVVPFRFRAPGR